MKYDKPMIMLISLVISLALASPSVYAKPKEGHDTPPGWSYGKKTGWEGENLPPGLAKKEGIDKGESEGETGEKVEKEEKEKKKQKEDAEKAAKQKKEKIEKEAKEKGKEAQKDAPKKKSRLKRILTWPFGQGSEKG